MAKEKPAGRPRPPGRATTGRLASRNFEIWRDYFNGATLDALAAQHGITFQRVSQILAEVRASIPEVDKVEHNVLVMEQLRWGMSELAKIFAAPPLPAYSNGRPIETDDGSPAEDHSGRLAAWDRILRTHERAAKMLGSDAVTEQSVTVTTSPEVAELVQVARARRAEREGSA